MVSFIRVYDSSNSSLKGEVRLGTEEAVWEFYPTTEWISGKYYFKVDVRLEDLAGNNIQGVFDRDRGVDNLSFLDQKEITLEFSILR